MIFGVRLAHHRAAVLISGENRIVSIADFLSSRYSRAPVLAALGATLALIAAVPYVTLQFKAVAMSVECGIRFSQLILRPQQGVSLRAPTRGQVLCRCCIRLRRGGQLPACAPCT
ncbi:MAG: hypothetical protein M3374_02335 [Pseudomonadota bacterium]|nr:hypothetical protein [Pseudomonadota bacterium]